MGCRLEDRTSVGWVGYETLDTGRSRKVREHQTLCIVCDRRCASDCLSQLCQGRGLKAANTAATYRPPRRAPLGMVTRANAPRKDNALPRLSALEESHAKSVAKVNANSRVAIARRQRAPMDNASVNIMAARHALGALPLSNATILGKGTQTIKGRAIRFSGESQVTRLANHETKG